MEEAVKIAFQARQSFLSGKNIGGYSCEVDEFTEEKTLNDNLEEKIDSQKSNYCFTEVEHDSFLESDPVIDNDFLLTEKLRELEEKHREALRIGEELMMSIKAPGGQVEMHPKLQHPTMKSVLEDAEQLEYKLKKEITKKVAQLDEIDCDIEKNCKAKEVSLTKGIFSLDEVSELEKRKDKEMLIKLHHQMDDMEKRAIALQQIVMKQEFQSAELNAQLADLEQKVSLTEHLKSCGFKITLPTTDAVTQIIDASTLVSFDDRMLQMRFRLSECSRIAKYLPYLIERISSIKRPIEIAGYYSQMGTAILIDIQAIRTNTARLNVLLDNMKEKIEENKQNVMANVEKLSEKLRRIKNLNEKCKG
ncbi:uncharacterized protein MONOS_16782 [Monocercomonoides exilis]|uniref:uncharacterized protein n=1 Tax=Monocercomonoides exilis TaxID=2049356 RepID=UPI0035598DA8|nr:hypothetical protein MONOS_16782 [Monocercomonoides exilis]|eukprot:MONOS_16782.1-p1 / transcript=MONOS_16782.1 / gene=MONOS_16782 / organism=Monocercomonoides_exilis_PA203 / gene_product=unspecified product / transcript_product=unspecified product / location=Mono_scaffold00173:14692-16174(-) / protein_length=362 / sequence_SO=supercontig / SO=protein_coding / is_pseudo=false